MTKEDKEFTLKCHEKMAKDCFNKTWDYMDKKERKSEDDIAMIHAAHASRFHWGILVENGKGTAVNLQRGEWQIARVYTILKRKESALYHANLCLTITKDNKIADFDLAFAYEAIARASALVGNKDDFKTYFELAEKAGNEIKDVRDKDYFFEELKGGKWFGMK